MDASNPIVSGLAGGLGVLILMYLAGRMKPVQPDGEGWLRIQPGWLFHSLFVACVLFVLVLSFALATISSRPDWREQITPLLLMLVGFGAGAIWVGWVSYGRTIHWNAEQIAVRRRLGHSGSWPWTSVRTVHTNNLSGEYVLAFDDGQKLRIPTIMKGAKQLALHLQERGFR